MKRLIRYNLLITILQFIVFAILLFSIFFLKFNLEQRKSQNTNQGLVIERNEY